MRFFLLSLSRFVCPPSFDLHIHSCRYANTHSLHYKTKKNEKYIFACLLVSIKWKYFAVYLDVVARMSIGSRGVWAITFSYFFFSMALRWPSLVNVCSVGTVWWAREGQKHLRFCLRHNGTPNKRWTMQQQQQQASAIGFSGAGSGEVAPTRSTNGEKKEKPKTTRLRMKKKYIFFFFFLQATRGQPATRASSVWMFGVVHATAHGNSPQKWIIQTCRSLVCCLITAIRYKMLNYRYPFANAEENPITPRGNRIFIFYRKVVEYHLTDE